MNQNHLIIYGVVEFKHNGAKRKRWTRIGVAFPHKDGVGFNLKFEFQPAPGTDVDLCLRPPMPRDERGEDDQGEA